MIFFLLLQLSNFRNITIILLVLLTRSKSYGWPNTYAFTKSMGEMLLGDLKGNVPLCIIRPTIITSTYKEPFPGWVEGIKYVCSERQEYIYIL